MQNLFLIKQMQSATERAATTTAPAASAAVTTATATATATTALATAACRQAVDAGACRVGLTASTAAAAARLVAARGELVGHQGVDVARQFVAIATRTALCAGCALAGWAVVEPTFWARAVVAVAVKTRRIATVVSVTTEFTASFIAPITTPAALGAATS